MSYRHEIWECGGCGVRTAVRHWIQRGGVMVHDPDAAFREAAGLDPQDYDLVSIDHAATGWMGVQEPGPHVLRTHPAARCVGQTCVIHNPSEHHMRGWSLNWRGDSGVMERICPHGVGHPDPDATAFARSQGRDWYGVHGCDGCCRVVTSPEAVNDRD